MDKIERLKEIIESSNNIVFLVEQEYLQHQAFLIFEVHQVYTQANIKT